MENIYNKLYEIQKLLTDEMPIENTIERKILDKIDNLIDELEGEIK